MNANELGYQYGFSIKCPYDPTNPAYSNWWFGLKAACDAAIKGEMCKKLPIPVLNYIKDTEKILTTGNSSINEIIFGIKINFNISWEEEDFPEVKINRWENLYHHPLIVNLNDTMVRKLIIDHSVVYAGFHSKILVLCGLVDFLENYYDFDFNKDILESNNV